MVDASFALMRQTRANFLQVIRDLDLNQLNHVPTGFSNNLIWNFGHMVVTLPILTYGLSGLPLDIDQNLVDRYRRGSRPEGPVDMAEWQHLQALSEKTLEQVEQDLQSGVFKEYKSYTTTYGVALSNVEDAIRFAPVHEGLHLGYAMAMIRQVR